MSNLPEKSKTDIALIRPEKVGRVNSFIQVFNDTSPSLSGIKKSAGEQTMYDYVVMWIMEFNVLIGERLSAEGMKMLSKEICAKYYYFKPSDLKFCFDKVKNTKLIYCSPQEILRVFEEYNNQRCQEAAIHSSKKPDDAGELIHKNFDKLVKTFGRGNPSKREKERAKEALRRMRNDEMRKKHE